jgi:hypothetical protein
MIRTYCLIISRALPSRAIRDSGSPAGGMGTAMNYRVEYNGEDVELSTLDAALDNAKNAIAADIGPISGWTVEHDETINDWFVQGVRNGAPVGPTAVVSGPEPMAQVTETGGVYSAGDAEDWARRVAFTGGSPAEVFGKAATWLAHRPDVMAVSDVSWQPGATDLQLRIYFR